MTDRFEYKGYWYLPSDSENAIAGILTYIPNESIILELIGSFGELKNNITTLFQRTTMNIIWGITSDAKKISLINCHPAGGKYNLSCPFSISKYSIQYCLDGIHLEKFTDKKFSWSNITIPVLSTWCFPSALKSTYSFNKNNKTKELSVSFNSDEIKEPIISVDISNNATLNIKKNVAFDSSNYYLNPTFNQSTFLQIQKRCKASISDFLSDIYLFENFMSLASLSTIKVSNILLFDETNYQELKSKEKIHHPIKLFYIQRNIELKENKKYDFLFSYNQIQDIYPDIIKKWYNETTEINPIRTHLIQSVKNKDIFNSTDFLIVIQAIEGFYIRFRKENSLTKILKELIDEFNDIRKVKQSDINIMVAVDSRHYYSHFMNKTKKPDTLDGVELFHLTKKLRIL